MAKYSRLRRYYRRLTEKTTPFTCPLCNMTVLFKEYEKHCTLHHKINSRLSCVWCQGNETWSRGDKSQRVDHLLKCWRSFMVLLPPRPHETRSEPSEPPSDFVLFDMSPTCESGQFFGRCQIPDLPDRAYHEIIWPLELNLPALTFQHDNINLAVSCVQTYLKTKDSSDWFHIMVRVVAMPSFLECMDNDAGQSRTLPFFCWCDGGNYEEARYRQHRHMIVTASPKGHFKKAVWNKIYVSNEDRPHKNYKCILSKKIHSAMHLTNTIGYLSNRMSRCNFSFDEDLPENLNHFLIHKALPADYRLPLVTQWDGGILQLIDQDYKSINPDKLVELPMKFFDFQWHIRVRDLPHIRLNLLMPLSECFQMSSSSSSPTEYFLHLTQGNRMYFEKTPLPSSSSSSSLPLFYYVVGHEWWIPSFFQGKCLDFMRPLYDRNVQLVVENQSLCQEIHTLKRKMEAMEQEALEKVVTLTREKEAFKEKLEESERENKLLLKKINQIYEKEIEKLKEENAKLKEIHAEELAKLREFYAEKVAKDTKEIAKLKEENRILREKKS